ncbi:MAG: hypothetical protein AB8G05_18275 [Oligoflexales bacterium]
MFARAALIRAEIAGHGKIYPSLQQVTIPGSGGKTVNLRSFVFDARVHEERPGLGGDIKWAYSLGMSYTSEAIGNADTNPFPYRYKDIRLEVERFADDKGRVVQNLDRLAWAAVFERFDLTIGRQAFAYGVARLANPTDVFAPYPLQRIDQEFRLGIDGVRMTVPLGELSEWEISAIVGENARSEESAGLTRYKTQIGTADSELILIHFRKAQLLGFNIEDSLWDVGIRIEGAIVKPGVEDGYRRLVVGGGYMLGGGSLFDLEYYYNEAGGDNRFAYPQLWGSFAYTKGGVFFQGQHYLSASYNDSFTPLLNGGGQVVVNLTDGTMLTVAQVNYNSSENSYIDFGCFLSPTHMSKDKFYPGEFASLGQQVFASARYYW